VNPFAVVEPAALLEVCRFAHGRSAAADGITWSSWAGVDYKDRIETVYIVTSLQLKHRLYAEVPGCAR